MKLSFIKRKDIQIQPINVDQYGVPLFEDGLPKQIPPITNKPSSFDIFDTILARRVDNIFDVVEQKFPYPGFKSIRESYFGTIDEIYSQISKHIDKDICKQLLEFEIEKEIENCYLILTNYNKVKDGDILVSDMYFTEDILRRILKEIGFNKDVKIYVTPNGKYTGNIWNKILKLHNIDYHFGDNEHSDVNNPKQYGITTYHSTLHQNTNIESCLKQNGYTQFSFLLREFRHRNPYPDWSVEFKLYNDQAAYNIPILIAISAILNDYMIKENRHTLLCQTRDGCLLEHIFSTLYPEYTCKRLESSRYMNRNPTPHYKEYIKSMYDHSTCILFDLDGSVRSGRHLYKELFGIYPRVYLFQYYYFEDAPVYDGLSYTFSNMHASLNSFNVDTVGTLIGYNDGVFIREHIRYSFEHANIFKQTVLSFCEFIKPHIHIIPKDPSLLVKLFRQYTIVSSHLKKDMED